MGNEEIGQTQFLAQIAQEVQHLRLNRDIEGGDRLVENKQIGLQRQRPGEADPLALAAGKTVRVTDHGLNIKADQIQAFAHRRPAACGVTDAVNQEWLGDDIGDRHPRIEGAEGILKDKLGLAPEGKTPRPREPIHIHRASVIVKHDLTAVGPNGAEQHLAERGLATSAFAHQSQAFPAHDIEADVIHCRDRAFGICNTVSEKPGGADAERLGDGLGAQKRHLDRRVVPALPGPVEITAG